MILLQSPINTIIFKIREHHVGEKNLFSCRYLYPAPVIGSRVTATAHGWQQIANTTLWRTTKLF